MSQQGHSAPVSETQSLYEDITNRKFKIRAYIAFWILGVCNNYGYVVMLSAAHDLLSDTEYLNETLINKANSTNIRDCNHISTGVVLLADVIPAMIIKITVPFMPICIHFRVAMFILTASASFLLVGFANSEPMAIAGVVITSISCGLGEATFLQYSSYYNRNVLSTWASGTGASGILSSTSYAGLMVYGRKIALLSMLTIPVLMAITFWGILPKPDRHNAQIIIELTRRLAELEEPVPETTLIRLKKKLKLLPDLIKKYIALLVLIYFLTYFINQGLFELIKFDEIFLNGPQQYYWFQITFQVGVFIARSSVNLFRIKRIYILTILQFIIFIILLCDSIFYFVPYIWLIFIIIFLEGLISGAAYVNTYFKLRKKVSDDKKQFSLSATSVSDTIGITIAGLIAIPIHNKICSLPKPNRASYIL